MVEAHHAPIITINEEDEEMPLKIDPLTNSEIILEESLNQTATSKYSKNPFEVINILAERGNQNIKVKKETPTDLKIKRLREKSYMAQRASVFLPIESLNLQKN